MGNVLSNGFQAATSFFLEKAKCILEVEDNIEALQEVEPNLKAVKDDLQNQIELEERKGLRVLEEVKVWLSKVEAIQPKVTKLLEDRTSEIERLSMGGYCSTNFLLTYSYGKNVFETLERVRSILSSKPSGEVVARRVLPPGIEDITTQRTVGLEKMFDATWSRLMEKDVGILGIYVVSQNLQVENIQKEISEILGLFDEEWEKNTQKEKTSRIYGALTRKRFVMLLDDIWRKVDLEEIGIPLPSPENGSKVVFTTRSKYVCGRMGPDDLEVKHLDPENAWELFRQKVRGATLDNDPKILELARKVCEKCKGLPLALNVIGETMAFKTSVREWQCAIDDLNSNADDYPEVKDEILKILKLSYDDLKDETVQQCFQYCVLFPGDFFIYKDMMVEYWISEGIINGGGDRERAINHGHRIFGKLVNACLLMPVDTSEYVTMHDVIRQMALWVASNCGEKEEKVIVKIGAGLQQMPEVRDWNAVRRMSLSNNKIQNISISPECPNLTTLLLRNNNLENISGEFFLSMPNLVTLNLSYNINLTKLPEEVSNLVSLRFLELTKTRLKNLPAGLGKLIQLRYLSLSCVQTRPSLSVISSLVNIEMLLLIKTTYLSLELIEDIKLMKNLKGLGVSIN
ncbi:Disease resistance protein (NBS-LRR class) family, partial [Raphanus sativus]